MEKKKDGIVKSEKRANPNREDAIFCLFMIVLVIFELFFVSTILFRCFAEATPPDRDTPPETDDSGKSDEEESPPTDPPADLPVFSGSSQVIRPSQNGGTVATLSDIKSQYAVLVHADTGRIIAQNQSDVRFSPASMTKVMTLIVACEQLQQSELDKKLTMTEALYTYATAGNYSGTTLYGIDVDDQYSIRDLLYGIGMKSASDCVVPIVFYVCEDERAFVELMNQKAEALGLENTHFDNAVGYDSEENYTTAEDLSVIMAYAMQSDLIRSILGEDVYRSTASGYNSKGEFLPAFAFTFYSTLFGSHDGSRMQAYQEKYGKPFVLEGAKLLAGKTGMTTDNYCLVSYAEDRDGEKYILVLGQAKEKHETMLDVKNVLDTYLK